MHYTDDEVVRLKRQAHLARGSSPTMRIVFKLCEDIEQRDAVEIQSGGHLGAVRSWMQNKFPKGSEVKWGDQRTVLGEVTAFDMERLAQRVADAVFPEKKRWLEEVRRLRSEKLRLEVELAHKNED